MWDWNYFLISLFSSTGSSSSGMKLVLHLRCLPHPSCRIAAFTVIIRPMTRKFKRKATFSTKWCVENGMGVRLLLNCKWLGLLSLSNWISISISSSFLGAVLLDVPIVRLGNWAFYMSTWLVLCMQNDIGEILTLFSDSIVITAWKVICSSSYFLVLQILLDIFLHWHQSKQFKIVSLCCLYFYQAGLSREELRWCFLLAQMSYLAWEEYIL